MKSFEILLPIFICKYTFAPKNRKEDDICVYVGNKYNKQEQKDYSGLRYEYLTYLSPIDDDCDGYTTWKAKCDCGNIVFCIPKSLKSCKDKDCHYHLDIKLRSKLAPKKAAASYIWRVRYSDGDIDLESFFFMSQLPCYYCLAPPSNRAKAGKNDFFYYNGLDRIDSSKGHIKENVVPCCIKCNFMKRALSLEEFFDHIERIYLTIKEKWSKG